MHNRKVIEDVPGISRIFIKLAGTMLIRNHLQWFPLLCHCYRWNGLWLERPPAKGRAQDSVLPSSTLPATSAQDEVAEVAEVDKDEEEVAPCINAPTLVLNPPVNQSVSKSTAVEAGSSNLAGRVKVLEGLVQKLTEALEARWGEKNPAYDMAWLYVSVFMMFM